MAPHIIQVLLVDDHEVVRSGYRRLLESTADIKVIAEAKSGEEAYTAYLKHQPDVVVMDLSMPGIGGLEAIRKIRHRDKAVRVLVFSMHESETFLNRALEEGVLGYITKRSAAKVMVEAIRQVAQGKKFIGQEMQVYLTKREGSFLSETLSPREFEIFLLLAEGKSVNEVAELLRLSSKTVGNHYTSIKSKLNISNASELTRLAIREGLLEP
jgi:two-component system invasion response regulator UvrY